MAAYEDEHGTYIMNSKDLRAVQHVERLTKMGVHSLKSKAALSRSTTAHVQRKFTVKRSTTQLQVNHSMKA